MLPARCRSRHHGSDATLVLPMSSAEIRKRTESVIAARHRSYSRLALSAVDPGLTSYKRVCAVWFAIESLRCIPLLDSPGANSKPFLAANVESVLPYRLNQ